MNRAKAVRSVRMSFVMLAFEMVICGHEVSWFNRQIDRSKGERFDARIPSDSVEIRRRTGCKSGRLDCARKRLMSNCLCFSLSANLNNG